MSAARKKIDAAEELEQLRRHAEDVLDRRLGDWGMYLRIHNRMPGKNAEGWDRENLLNRMRKTRGITIEDAPRDWAPEEEVDVAVRVLQLLQPEDAAALYARYVYQAAGKDHKARLVARVKRMWQILSQAGYEQDVSIYRFNSCLSNARRHVRAWIIARA